MPFILRDYECTKCGHIFEDCHTEAEPATCTQCKSTDVVEKTSSFKNYHIHGDNSASTRPRRR